jgi:hypothetical protein
MQQEAMQSLGNEGRFFGHKPHRDVQKIAFHVVRAKGRSAHKVHQPPFSRSQRTDLLKRPAQRGTRDLDQSLLVSV